MTSSYLRAYTIRTRTHTQVNMATMKKLRAHGLSVPSILDTPDAKLNELIHAVGFHNNKVWPSRRAASPRQQAGATGFPRDPPAHTAR